MTRYLAVFAVLGLFVGGCASSQSQAGSSSAAQGGVDVSRQANDDSPAPPAGALYTLHCAVYTSPMHIEEATRAKNALIRSTGSKQWYVVHGAEQSDLYYGYYKTFEDRSQIAEYTRAQADRAKVASLVDAGGDPIFQQVTFGSINLPDPPAPKEWDLSSNPGYWTLQIAVYKGSPERKQAAVDAVKGFREHGIQAYFRHGAATSEVYIGSWPKEAVAEQDSAAAESNDPDQPLLVVPGPLPKGVDSNNVYDDSGRKMKVVMPKLEIVDPDLKRTTEQYPYYYVNGEVAGRKTQTADHQWQVVPWASYLIQVPHETADPDQQAKTDLGQDPSVPAANNGDVNPAPAVPGLDGLR